MNACIIRNVDSNNLKMTISELILTLPPDAKSLIRSIEKRIEK